MFSGEAMRIPRLTYAVLLAAATLWCTAILVPPLLRAQGDTLATSGVILHAFFSPVCHQIEGRCLTLAGFPLAVCARCTSIYVGFWLGLVFYPFLRSITRPVMPPRWFIVLAVLPMLLDVLAGLAGVQPADLTTRLVTGGVCGVFLAFIVLPGAVEAALQLVPRSHTVSVHVSKGPSHA